jgi:hypothetical protein
LQAVRQSPSWHVKAPHGSEAPLSSTAVTSSMQPGEQVPSRQLAPGTQSASVAQLVAQPSSPQRYGAQGMGDSMHVPIPLQAEVTKPLSLQPGAAHSVPSA